VGRHAGLALRSAELGAALARQVEQLSASRERLVRAEDEARRRIERDLHDGIQQQVVVLLGRLGLLRSKLVEDSAPHDLAVQSQALAQAVLSDLRDVVRGIHPPLLTDRGLVAAVEAQADLLTVPVTVDVDPRLERQRFAADVETAAYYVVSEAITNVIKHSGAERARVVLTPYQAAGLQVAVVDEGHGFELAAHHSGSGLRGLRDRVEAVGGTLEVASAPGVGTTVLARFHQRVLADA
jgi:signal transduction histidine kinase